MAPGIVSCPTRSAAPLVRATTRSTTTSQIDQLTAGLRDEMRTMGVDTSDRRRTADVAFGAMRLAEMIDRAMSAADMDDDGGVVSGAVEAVGRALRVLASV